MRGSSWLAGLLVAVGMLAAPAIGMAHSRLVSAEPATDARLGSPVSSVRLAFSARVEDAFLILRVTRPDGRVISGPAGRDPRDARAITATVRPTERGPLIVTWRVLSQDGHPSGGAHALGVGAPGGVVSGAGVVRSDHGILPVLARLLALIGPLGLVGLATLAAAIVGPAVRAGGVVVPGEGSDVAIGFRERTLRALGPSAVGWWRAWWALAATGALGALLGPLAVLWGLRERPGELGALLGQTRFGAAWAVQCVALLILLVASVLVRRSTGERGLPGGPWPAVLLAAGPFFALGAISWGGHASAGADATANIVIDLLHNLATAAWIGGLLGLAVLVTPTVNRLEADDRVRLAAAVVVRFSSLAMVAVAVLVVTGIYRTLAEVSVGQIVDTDYGRVLMLKLGLFALLLVGGGYNRLVLHPRLERAALGLDPDDRGAEPALRVSVRAELVVSACLLVSVALLVSLPPPV